VKRSGRLLESLAPHDWLVESGNRLRLIVIDPCRSPSTPPL
jgi:hypothetical protein